MTVRTLFAICEFKCGLEAQREVFGAEISLPFELGDLKISFPTVNANFAGFEEQVEQPLNLGFQFSLRDSASPSHISDPTWGSPTSLSSSYFPNTRRGTLNTG